MLLNIRSEHHQILKTQKYNIAKEYFCEIIIRMNATMQENLDHVNNVQ